MAGGVQQGIFILACGPIDTAFILAAARDIGVPLRGIDRVLLIREEKLAERLVVNAVGASLLLPAGEVLPAGGQHVIGVVFREAGDLDQLLLREAVSARYGDEPEDQHVLVLPTGWTCREFPLEEAPVD